MNKKLLENPKLIENADYQEILALALQLEKKYIKIFDENQNKGNIPYIGASKVNLEQSVAWISKSLEAGLNKR
jgi:hypothetical protein